MKKKHVQVKRLLRTERQGSGKWVVRVQQDLLSIKERVKRKKRPRKKSSDNEKEINAQVKRLMRLERQGSGKWVVRVQQDLQSIKERVKRKKNPEKIL